MSTEQERTQPVDEEEARFKKLFDIIHGLIYEPDPKTAEDGLKTLSEDFEVDFEKISSAACEVGSFLRIRREAVEDAVHFIGDIKVGLRNCVQRDEKRLSSGAVVRSAKTLTAGDSRRKRVRAGRDPNRLAEHRAEMAVAEAGQLPAESRTQTVPLDEAAVVQLSSALLFACGDGPPSRADTAIAVAAAAQVFIRQLLVRAAEMAETALCEAPVVVDDRMMLRAVQSLFPPAAGAAAEHAFVMSTLCTTSLQSWSGTAAFRDALPAVMRGSVLPRPPASMQEEF